MNQGDHTRWENVQNLNSIPFLQLTPLFAWGHSQLGGKSPNRCAGWKIFPAPFSSVELSWNRQLDAALVSLFAIKSALKMHFPSWRRSWQIPCSNYINIPQLSAVVRLICLRHNSLISAKCCWCQTLITRLRLGLIPSIFSCGSWARRQPHVIGVFLGRSFLIKYW